MNSRIDEHARERALDAGFERASRAARCVELEQRRERGVVGGNGPAIGALGEPPQDLGRARAFLGVVGRSGVQTKIRRRLGVSPTPVGAQRADDRDGGDARRRRVHGEQVVDALRVALAHDRDAERLRPGRDRQRRAARAAAAEHAPRARRSRDLDLFVAAERFEAEAAAAAADADLVLGVERKHVPDAASRRACRAAGRRLLVLRESRGAR